MIEEQEVRDVIRPYVVDGIQEYDNPLPPWWTWMFILCIAFGFGYVTWIHGFGWNRLDDELEQAQVAHAALMKEQNTATTDPGELELRIKNPQLIDEGKAIYVANCAPCHGPSGGGVVGPNLTDHFWLHGGSPANVVAVISNGVIDKGMLAWGPILGPKKIEAVASFILSLKDSQPANAKAAQGEEYKP